MATDKQTTLANLYRASLKQGAQSSVEKNRAYVQQQIAKGTAAPKPETQVKNPPPANFLEGVLNVLEGPMQGMYKATGLSKFAEPEYAKQVMKDPAGTAGKTLLESLIPGRLLYETGRSWFDPNFEKTYGADIIEGATDAANLAQGVDTSTEEDTVNPWVKGIGGFALDVAADPLTYVPGVVFTKPITAGAKVVGKALGLPAKGVKSTGRTIEQAAQDLAGAETAAARSATETVVQATEEASVGARAAQDVAENADSLKAEVEKAAAANASDAEISQTIAKGIEDAQVPAVKAPKVEVPVRVPTLGETLAPQFKKSKGFLAKFGKDLAKATTEADKVKVVDAVVDLRTKSMDYDGKRIGALKPDEWILEDGRSFTIAGATYNSRTLANAYKKGTLGKLPPAVQQVFKTEYNKFVSRYKKAYEEGRVITPKGGVYPIEELAAAQATTPENITALGLFRQKMEQDAKFTANAVNALGKPMTSEIAGKMSPTRFEKFLKDVGKLFDGTDVDTISSMDRLNPGSQQYLLSKGITDADLQANYNRIRAELDNVDPDLAVKAGQEAGVGVRQVLQESGISPAELMNEIDDSFRYTTTGKRTKKTAKNLGYGKAVQQYQINQYPQTTLFTKILKSVMPGGKIFSGPKLRKNGSISAPRELYGPQRVAAAKEATMGRLAVVEDYLDTSGVPTFFFYGEHLVPIRMGQAMDTVMQIGGSSAERVFFNGSTLIPPTNFAEVIAYMDTIPENAALDLDEMRRIIQNTETPNKRSSSIKNMLNPNVASDEMRVIQHYVTKPSAPMPKGQKLVKNEHASRGWFRVIDPEAATDDLIDALVRARPALSTMINASKSRYATRLTIETSALTDDEMKAIMDAFETGGQAGLLKELSNSKKNIQNKAKAVGAMDTSSEAAAKMVEASVDEPMVRQAETVVPAAEESARIESKMKLASSDKAVKEATKPLKEESQKLAKEELDRYLPDEDIAKIDEADPPRLDISTYPDQIAAASQKTLFNKMYYTLNKMFNARSGIASGWEMQHGASGIMAHVNVEFNKMFQSYARKYRTPMSGNPNVNIADEAMRLVQQKKLPAEGMNAADAARLAEAMPEAQKLWDLIFLTDSASTGLLGSDYFKSGAGVELINNALARFGAGSKTNKLGVPIELAEEKGIFQFDPDIARDASSLSGRTIYDELVDQARNWDLGDNPLDTLRTVQASFTQAMMHANVSDQLQAYAVKMGVYSKSPVKGWFQPAASKRSVTLSQLDANGYYPPEFLEEVAVLDRFLQESRTLDGPFGEFMHKTLDPVLDAWKFGMTIIRPGHHIRNAIGDASITYAAEGVKSSRVASVDATRLLAYKGASESKYEVMDYMAMLNRLDPKATANAQDVLATVSLKNGAKAKLTVGGIRQKMEEKGLFPGFGVSEDLLGEGTGVFAKVARTVSLQNRVTEKIGGGISQYRDHWARAQHFMQYVRNNASKFTNEDDLYEAAAKQVKKYHPDGSMLSAFESKYMRRAIPFYSWMRGILPGAIEATIAHPGRFMIAPKASFNLAVAMGVDPTSLSDPFPEDQMFPSFIREDALGPQFLLGEDYIRANPGVATLDLAGTFSGGIGQGVISSLNPMFKLPFELNNLTRIDTGAKIHDVSDYLDSQIPNVGPISNVTGTSVTGTLGNLLTGQFKADQQYQVEKGNKGPTEQGLSLLNWLSGMQVQNLSQPNLVNYAEIEARNAALEQKKAQEGK